MEKYSVKITDAALADMEALYNYIAKNLQAPGNALGQYNRIADAIMTLESFPERNGLFDAEPERSKGIHRMAVDNYLVCYVINSGVVTVTDVLYGASDIHTRLVERHKLSDSISTESMQ